MSTPFTPTALIQREFLEICGFPRRQIVPADAAAPSGDFIVMQSHRPEMPDYLIGPNVAFVAMRAKCSVLVLRQPELRPSH